MASITIVFRKDKLNGQREGPVHFRITKNRKSSYIASGIRVSPRQWDEKKSKVKATCSNSARVNAYLSGKFAEIQDTVLQHESSARLLTSKQLKEKVFGKKPTAFFAFADTVIQQYKDNGKIGTHDKNKSILSKLREYRPSLSFHDITPEFLTRYEQYLREKKGNQTNTVSKDMKFIRKIFNNAIREDVIEQENTPFRKYQLKSEKTHRDYLTAGELLQVEECNLGSSIKLRLHRDMFVFATYAGGLRISDVLKLQWSNFDGTHLHIVIQKTGMQVSIKVPDKAVKIIRRYRRLESDGKDFIFPVLPAELDPDHPKELDAAIASATTQINRSLKTIAGAVGIEKRLSFHVSRHSFAVMALRKGISIDKVSKLMAHSAIKETQVYAKIMNEELDRAMDALNT